MMAFARREDTPTTVRTPDVAAIIAPLPPTASGMAHVVRGGAVRSVANCTEQASGGARDVLQAITIGSSRVLIVIPAR